MSANPLHRCRTGAALANDEIRMTNPERRPKPENPIDRTLVTVGPCSICLAVVFLLCNGCAHMTAQPGVGSEQQVRAVLDAQVRAWNAGDLRGFMDGYARSDQTRFQSGGDVSLGWQTVFDRYQKRYGDRASMGVLKF